VHYQRVLELPGEEDPLLLYRYGFALFSVFGTGDQELSRAVEGALAAEDRELAAEAQAQLAVNAWNRGDRELTDARLAVAEEIAAGLSVSRAKAHVLATAARYQMLAGRYEEAIRVGEEALVMAAELGADEIRMNALTSVGPALASTGDYEGGRVALEQAIELGERHGYPDVQRSYNNLASIVAQHGDIRRCLELHRAAVELSTTLGHGPWVRWLRGELASDAYFLGDWGLVVSTADLFEQQAAAGDPHYLLHALHAYRSLIRIARGDVEGALSDAARALEQGREARDPQALQPGLSCSVYLDVLVGGDEEARKLLDEMIADPKLAKYAYEPELAWTAIRLGRGDALLRAIERNPESRWKTASLAFFRGDLLETAALYDEGGFICGAALVRIWAAEQLLAEARPAEAEEQLELALAFWRSVGATRYIAEAEGLRAQAASA
jgi:tetratricopeptide (TPR) repeat protein